MFKRYICVLLICNVSLFACHMVAMAGVELAWERSYDFGGYDVQAPAVDDSGNVYVTTQAPDGVGILKYDAEGNLVYAEVWEPGVTATPLGIGADSLGNAYIVGTTNWPTDQADIFALKYDASGGLTWEELYDQENLRDEALAMVVDDSGNVHISGFVTVTRTELDPYQRWILLKYNCNGNQVYNHLHTHPDCVNEYQNCGWTAESEMDFIVLDGEKNAYSVSGALGMNPLGTYPYVARVSSSSGEMTSSGALDCDSLGDWIRVRAEGLAVDQEGNVYLSMWWYLNPDEGNCLKKLDPSLTNEEWSVEQDHVHKRLLTDSQGNLYMTSGGGASTGPLHKINPEDGSELCTFTGPYFYGLDQWDNLYLNRDYLVAYDSECNELWSDDGLPSGGRSVVFDKWGDIYMTWLAYGEVRVARYIQEKALFIKDGSEDNDSIPNTDFHLIRITDDPEPFTEDSLGEFTTDEEGKLVLESLGAGDYLFENNLMEQHTLHIGDRIKVSKHLVSEQALMHTDILWTMYSVFLDNATFDTLGVMDYPELTVGWQNVIMDHPEFRYNLVVSVEWDAEEQYLNSMEEGFRSMSNFLYDATDGMVRLDTVRIYDNRDHWYDADVLIHANNVYIANAWGMADPNCHDRNIETARKDYIGWEADMADSSYMEYWTYTQWDLNTTDDFCTKAHEFGHYAIALLDEYKFNPEGAERCQDVPNYGMMDKPWPAWGVYGSELSSTYRYVEQDCRNTDQWHKYGMSCWDYVDSLYEGKWGEDSIFVSVTKPDERTLPSGKDYLEGPNDNWTEPDYDVGALVEFPITHTPPAAQTVQAYIHEDGDFSAGVAYCEVVLIKASDGYAMSQGYTGERCCIWVVGKEPGDEAWCYHSYIEAGHSVRRSMARVVGNSRLYSGKITFDGSDSVSIAVRPVEGDYPLICGIDLSENTATYWLDINQSFSENPTVNLCPEIGSQYSYSFSFVGSGYATDITDDPGYSGTFIINAVDDSSNAFFFMTDYAQSTGPSDSSAWTLFAAKGRASIRFDSLNTDVEKAILLSSPYPVIAAGLEEGAMQGGLTHCLSVHPSALAGNNRLTIHYYDSEVEGGEGPLGNESNLQIYRWNETQWEMVGGYVDTALDVVSAMITEPGVYGAFTTTATFLRGDANADGVISAGDVVYLLNYLYRNDPPPDPYEAGDANCDGVVNAGDVVRLLNYLFRGWPAPHC